MTIGIVINRAWNIYNFRKGLAETLLREGHEVLAIAPEDEYAPLLEDLGCRFIALKMEEKSSNPLGDLLLISSLHRIYRKHRLDMVLHYTIKPNIYGTFAAYWAGVFCINNVSGLGTVFIRKNFTTLVAKNLYRLAFRFPATVFFQNPDDRRLFLDKGFVRTKQARLLPGSGVDVRRFSPRPAPPKSPFTFLMIARLLYDKGIREFAEAARQLKKEGDFSLRICLLGALETERNLGPSEKQIRDWEREGLMEYLGTRPDVRPAIAEAHCVVLPSYREGTPKSLLEAAAMGKPLIATDVPGCREIVRNNRNGLLCRAGDAEDLAKKMALLLRAEPQTLAQMGQNSRRLALENFDEKIVIDHYLSAIAEFASKNKKNCFSAKNDPKPKTKRLAGILANLFVS